MRIHDKGDYAYELQQSIDPRTQLRGAWKYRVFRVRPIEQMVDEGEAQTREQAEKLAKRAVSRMLQRERRAA